MAARTSTRARKLLPLAGIAVVAVTLYALPVVAQGSQSAEAAPTHMALIDRLGAVESNLAQQHDALGAMQASSAREPMNFSSSTNVDAGGNASFVDVFTVPDDKWLVLEYISFRAFVGIGPDRLVSLRVFTTAGGTQSDHRIGPSPLVSTNIPEQEGGSVVKLYAEPGSTLTYIAQRGCCGDVGTVVNVAFSGYLTERP